MDRIEGLIGLEPFLIIIGLSLLAFGIYKIFLGKVAHHRHKNLRALFLNLTLHTSFLAILLTGYTLGIESMAGSPLIARLLPYYGLFMIFTGLHAFIKVFRIFVFEYLFIQHMNEGVPLLLVNLTSLLLSVVLYGWVITEVLAIKVLPVLATSAVFTAIVGLALQDTLGNLFAGVALQFDKPFELGDWVEVFANGQKWTGQVDEISWRATVLISFTDELISIPNKVISQALVSNFSKRSQPIARSQVFKIPFNSNLEKVRRSLIHAIDGISGIEKTPAPLVLAIENGDYGLTVKLIYFVRDYGAQYAIGTQVLEKCHKALPEIHVEIARMRIETTTAPT